MARVQYSDVVINSLGAAQKNNIISITPVAGTSATNKLWKEETGPAELASVITNSSGLFSVWLDEGRYDVKPEGGASKRVEIISDPQVVFNNLLWISVKNPTWGAKGDGVTDDTIAIQNAHEAVVSGGGGVLFFPAGTYITKGLVLSSKIHLMGSGINTTILKMKANTVRSIGVTGDVIVSKEFSSLAASAAGGSGAGTSLGGINSFSIDNLTVDGNSSEQSAGQGGAGIRLYGYGYQIGRVTARHCMQNSFISEWGSGGGEENDSMESVINDSKFHECEEGIYFNGPHDSTFKNCQCYGNKKGSIGFDLGTKSNGVELIDCHPWAFNKKPLSIGARLRGSGNKIVSGQYEGHYEGGVGIQIMSQGVELVSPYIYTTGEVLTGRGIQFGSITENQKGEAGSYTASGNKIDAIIFNCTEGPLDFQKCANSDIKALVYCPKHSAFIGTPAATNTYNVYNIGEGSESTGNIYRPTPFYGGGLGKGAQIQVSHKTGAAEDADFPVEVADGTAQVNTSSNLWEFRSSGSWHAAGVPGFESIIEEMIHGESVSEGKLKGRPVSPAKVVLATKPAAAGEGLTTLGEKGIPRKFVACINGNGAIKEWEIEHKLETHSVSVVIQTSSGELPSEIVTTGGPTIIATTNEKIKLIYTVALGAGVRHWITVLG